MTNHTNDRISVEKASEMLGVTEQMLRVSMAQGLIDIGYVYGTGRRKTYVIYGDKVKKLKGERYEEKD